MNSSSVSLGLGRVSDTLSPFAFNRVILKYSEQLAAEIDALAARYQRWGNTWSMGIGLGLAAVLLIACLAARSQVDLPVVAFWAVFGSIVAFLAIGAALFTRERLIPEPLYWEKLAEVMRYAERNFRDVIIASDGSRVEIRMPGEVVALTGAEADLFLRHADRR